MSYKFTRDELSEILPTYQKIRDCLGGSRQVKNARETYLPKPNPSDVSEENTKRYEHYLTRALFYNVSARTHSGLVGRVLSKEISIEFPDLLNEFIEDSNASGVSFLQQIKSLLSIAISHGRAGLFVDFPSDESFRKFPTLTVCRPEDVINWRVSTVNGRNVYSLIVFKESFDYTLSDDMYSIKKGVRYRTLYLDENLKYAVRLRTEDSDEELFFQPTGFNGERLNEIPFSFVGSVNNDEKIDKPPLDDLCDINIAHYRNSADFEESCFMVGQPTPYFTGLTAEWYEDVLKGAILLGSRSSVALPEGATAGLLQADANNMVKEAMQKKEEQMRAIGANLITTQGVQKTATEIFNISQVENSLLQSVANNVQEAAIWAMKTASEFLTDKIDESKFDLRFNGEYNDKNLTMENAKEIVSFWMQEAISFTEMRSCLKSVNIAEQSDEDALREIANEEKQVDKVE